MFTIELSGDDRTRIDALIAEILDDHGGPDDPDLLDRLTVYAQELPRSVRLRANRFRLHEPAGGCVFTGFRVDDDAIGDTPARWGGADRAGTAREDLFLLLCAALLGDPVAWATQQDGRMLHDVMPIKGHELEQINSSTSAPLWWHTEDAFHPYRAHYVGLLCLRNPDAVETTYAAFDDLRLDEDTLRTLMEPRFVIRPDESHLPKNRGAAAADAPRELLERSFAWVEEMNTAPRPTPVLFGDPKAPYGRLDPYFMDRMEDDPQAMAAFDAFVKEIDDKITSVVLSPGDVLFIDNYKAVHGRKPFEARFDGRDRWLRRVNVTRDLRRSRSARADAGARVIF
ncbi:guanitoxin biosynthesis L-enduracididine beta-hydroxylase GntD [Streptomyces sp. NPDC051172]|uniref:guanitoxin biosynthesis L-enduracididine beta-hydroxylase GntD n=1 Tax=Streptomyces sp. NPDC051172 TaxID=3155796 RepID=UPI00341732A1